MEGWRGWDEYARFYDWENARTMRRHDVRFWQALARREGGPVLELGCGTGRVTLPVARTGVRVVGVDRSLPMLAYAWRRSRRLGAAARPRLVRGDIRSLPFEAATFTAVLAPYGILQSLTREADLAATLREAARVVVDGGTLGIDLVPDLPAWDEYRRRVRLRGVLGQRAAFPREAAAAGGPGTRRRRDAMPHVTLIESVRQDRRRRLTIFDQEYVERLGARTRRHRFSLAFRTLPLPEMVARVERAGFRVTALLGDYRGRAWDLRADVWLIVAARQERRSSRPSRPSSRRPRAAAR